MEPVQKPELIDRNEAIRVFRKMIDARCTCTRTGTIEIRAFEMAIMVLQRCQVHPADEK